ncbi:glycosyltransferase family 4 protein [Curtobacterium citreum]
MSEAIEIVQVVRRMRSGGGVGGVAVNLASRFEDAGVLATVIEFEDVFLGRLLDLLKLPGKLGLAVEVVWFSLFSPIAVRLRRRRNPGAIFISHNDCISGDIYVNHGVHKVAVRMAKNPFKMLLRNPLHWFLLLREALRYRLNLHKVIVNFSPEGEAELRSAHRVRTACAVIPNGVDLEVFFPDETSGNRWREGNGFSEGDFLIGFVGHEVQRKGLDVCLEALSLLPQRFKLVVAGGGAAFGSALKACAERAGVVERVLPMGSISDLRALYCGVDALALPSTYETWGLVLLEAMACGTPVLATPVSSIPSFVRDGETGLHLDRSPTQLARLLSKLADEPELSGRLAESGKRMAGRYDWNAVARQYVALAAEVARRET